MGRNARYGLTQDRAAGRREASEHANYRPVTPRVRHVWVQLSNSPTAAPAAGIVLGWRQEHPAPARDHSGWCAQIAYVTEHLLHVAWFPVERVSPLT